MGSSAAYDWTPDSNHSVLASDVSQEGTVYGVQYRILIEKGTAIRIPSTYEGASTQARYLMLLVYPDGSLFIDTTWQTFSKPITVQKFVNGAWVEVTRFNQVIRGNPVLE